MSRTLLIGSPSTTWRDWLKENRGDRDLLCLDPSEPSQSPPGRLTLQRGDKIVGWKFFGGLDPQRAPHTLVAAAAQLLPLAREDVIVQLYAHRPAPMLRQVTLMLAGLIQPDEILVPSTTRMDLGGFPVGPETVELEPAFPPMVQTAMRKAQWMKLLENCEEHEVDLDQVTVEGARLGAGNVLRSEDIKKLGIDDVYHAEVASGTLLLITDQEPDGGKLARALDVAHCSKAQVVGSASYDELLCAFAKASGEDFGIGIVDRIDFRSRKAHIRNTAVPPAPVRLLRLGGIRIDEKGNEHGELKPWQV